ncbi:MAG: MarR family transcriptional regulator [Deltaproteobacteria bacterium]|nr:MarR family transcriptional regulator [Deltaproteobacteria bacterium]
MKLLAERELSAIGVSTAQMGILEMLRAKPGLSQNELGEALAMDRTSIGAAVAQLETSGIVERLAHPTDGRSYAVRLTASGEDLAEKAAKRALVAQRRFLEPLGETERKQLFSILGKLLEAD